MELEVNGQYLSLTDRGFLMDTALWSEAIAIALADKEAIVLMTAHWEILYFIREYYQRYKHLPNTRVFIKAIKLSLGEEKGNSRYLHQLFPSSPLKYACKLAGLPKPPSCL